MSPSNLQILKPCLPYTQVITRLLCDVWVCSSPLFALCFHRGPAPGFFLPLLLAQGADTIFSLLPPVSWAGVNKNTPTQTWGQLSENIFHFEHQLEAGASAGFCWVIMTPRAIFCNLAGTNQRRVFFFPTFTCHQSVSHHGLSRASSSPRVLFSSSFPSSLVSKICRAFVKPLRAWGWTFPWFLSIWSVSQLDFGVLKKVSRASVQVA